ncbi:MAG: MFS transporter, partial [Acidobacteriota bacterium]
MTSSPKESSPPKSPPWYRQITPTQKKSLLAASMGWMLDSMDIMLYALVLAHLMKSLGMSTAMGG